MLYFTIRREISQEQYEQLKLELFKAILTYAQGPKIVRSKLCVTVTIFLLRIDKIVQENILLLDVSNQIAQSYYKAAVKVSITTVMAQYC